MSPMLCQTLRPDAMGFVNSGTQRFSSKQPAKKVEITLWTAEAFYSRVRQSMQGLLRSAIGEAISVGGGRIRDGSGIFFAEHIARVKSGERTQCVDERQKSESQEQA
jgi:hypothetical protein